MKTKPYMAAAAMTMLCMEMLSGCGQKSQSVETDHRETPKVSVSLAVEQYFAERLAGKHIEVNVMIPQTADHDTYTPKPGQMKSVSQSAMYLAFGPLEFEEAWRDRLCDGAPQMKWTDLSEGVEMQEHDPHYWMSPKQVKTMTRNMAEALKPLMPEGYDMDSALTAVMRDVEQKDSALTAVTSQRQGTSFLVYHPSLSYLARDYGLNQISIAKDETMPSPKTYKERIAEAQAAGVKVIFAQQGYDPGRLATAAAELNATQVSIMPEGKDWMGTMAKIAEALKAAQ